MKSDRNRRNGIWAIFLAAFILAQLTVACRMSQVSDPAPKVNNGTIDLRAHDFSANPVVELDGRWSFYWERWVPPASLRDERLTFEPPGTIQVPSSWNGYVSNGKKVGGQGYATYALQLQLPSEIDAWSLHVPGVCSGYTLYINGRKKVSVGSPDKSRSKTIPGMASRVVDFVPAEGPVSLIFHVSNFHYVRGGLWETVSIGPTAGIHQARTDNYVRVSFLLGAILLIGLYHLGLFFTRRDEPSYLFFSLFCLLMSLRIVVLQERMIMDYLTGLSMNMLFKLEYLSFYLGGASILAYLHHLFPTESSKRLHRAMQLFILVFSAAVVLLPVTYFSYTLRPFQIFTIACVVYCIWVLLLVVKRKRYGSKLFFAGALLLSAAVVNDLLHAMGLLNTAYLFHWGSFAFILCQTSILVLKYTRAFKIISKQELALAQNNLRLTDALNQRLEVEKKLRDSETQKEAILDASIDSIRLVDSDLKILWSNKIVADQTGKQRDKIAGNHCYRIFTGRQQPCSNCPSIKAIETGKIEHAIIKETDVKNIAGVSYWADYAVPFKNEKGEVAQLLQVSRDITQPLRARDSLLQGESRYRALFENNPMQIVVVDKNAKITMFNFAKERAPGRSPKKGDIMYRDYAAKHAADMHRELMDCMQTRRNKTFEEVKYKDRYLNIRISPFIGGAIITSEDITERKQLQKQLEHARKMETVGTLSGGIAHEFNNILGIILGNTELAMDDIPSSHPAYDFLLETQTASLRGKEVVGRLLSFSHKPDARRRPLEVQEVVRESIRLLRTTLPSAIDVVEEISDDCGSIMGDRSQIHQLMSGLCTNAAQAMPDGTGRIRIALSRRKVDKEKTFAGQQLGPGEYVQLCVEDTGRGIAPDIIENVFEPFFTTKGIHKGAGLGLAVAYGIVQSHDGFIEIESRLGRYTRVVCYFPAKKNLSNAEPKTVSQTSRGGETVLLADDEPSLAKMGKQLLERLGYGVEAYTHPGELLEAFKGDPAAYDLVITDMTMPQMTGTQLIAELKKIRSDVKTIICSGFSNRMNERAMDETGAGAFVMKPIDREKLASTVRKVLDS